MASLLCLPLEKVDSHKVHYELQLEVSPRARSSSPQKIAKAASSTRSKTKPPKIF